MTALLNIDLKRGHTVNSKNVHFKNTLQWPEQGNKEESTQNKDFFKKYFYITDMREKRHIETSQYSHLQTELFAQLCFWLKNKTL